MASEEDSNSKMTLERMDIEMFACYKLSNNDISRSWDETASNAGRMKNLRLRRNKNFPFSTRVNSGESLRDAATVNNENRVNFLLRYRQANPNSFDDVGRTALHIAASRGYEEIVHTLLTYGANPNLEDELGNTPLHLAVYSGSVRTAEHLITHGSDIRRTAKLQSTPLELAECKYKILDKAPLCSIPKMQVREIIKLLRHALVLRAQMESDLAATLNELSDLRLENSTT